MMPNVSSSHLIRSVPHNRLVQDMVAIRSRTSGIGCDECQTLAPAGEEFASQDPQQLVVHVQPDSGPRSSRARQHRQLIPQQQVLEDAVVPRAY
jgi:hypothetical protein